MKALFTASMTTLQLLTTLIIGHAQVPVAVVEDAIGKRLGVEFMDYVAEGKVIRLGPSDAITLGYMKSCLRESIRGAGVVTVGREQSAVTSSLIERQRVECDATNVQIADAQGTQTGATVFRSVDPKREQQLHAIRIYSLFPVFELNGPGRLIIERTDAPGERHEVMVTRESLLKNKFYDLASSSEILAPGASYVARQGNKQVAFTTDLLARPRATPIVGRLVRFK